MKMIFNNFLKNSQFTQIGRILIFSVLVGIIAGLGAIALYVLIQFFTHFAIVKFCGYKFAETYGEASLFHVDASIHLSRWKLLLIPALGGLISGFLVFKFAPEAEGHGTDSVIDTIHTKNGRFKWQVPLIKAVASDVEKGLDEEEKKGKG